MTVWWVLCSFFGVYQTIAHEQPPSSTPTLPKGESSKVFTIAVSSCKIIS